VGHEIYRPQSLFYDATDCDAHGLNRGVCVRGGDVDNWLSRKGCALWNSFGCDRRGGSSLGRSRSSSGVAISVVKQLRQRSHRR
jgi:hypothetical protein